jgi:hypothetical protein
MTTQELLYLSWLSYIDLPELYRTLIARGGKVPVSALADTILRMDAAGALPCVKMYDAARAAARAMKDSTAVLTGYVNDNQTDGFVAYTFEDGGETVVAMRGSESRGECVPTNIDWTDNFCEPFAGSVQYPQIEKIASAYPSGNVIFTGHSKGGHNALYARAVSQNPNARAVAFNSQGFARGALNQAQTDCLEKSAVNYVVSQDLIGALLGHPERRVYVKQAAGTEAHMPEAFLFDEDGEPVPTLRAPKSLLTEFVTRAVDRALNGGTREKLKKFCKSLVK